MVQKMRLPLLIAVVVVVALLLPGPALMAAPSGIDAPRMQSFTSYMNGSPGIVLVYGAKGDPKTGMVTFNARVYNTYAQVTWRMNKIRAKMPWNAQLLESWGGLPGSNIADGPDPEGWIQWNTGKAASETNTAYYGFTVGGWDGKSQLTVGWEASWMGSVFDKKPNSLSGYTDDTNNRNNVKVVTVNYPFDLQTIGGQPTKGIYRAVGFDGSNEGTAYIMVPSADAFLALKKDVDALKTKAALPAGQDE